MESDRPIIGINLKTYSTAIGMNAVKIAKAAEDVSKAYGCEIFLCVMPTDLRMIKASVSSIKIFAQHMDPVEEGAFTGHITPVALKDAGADGVMLNHSEKRLRLDHIDKCVSLAIKYGLKTLICANTPLEVKAVACFDVDMVAVEPPELIGGKVSVSTAKPEIVKSTVKMVREVNRYTKILVGAGIKNNLDVRKSMALGADGVLLASAVAKSQDPRKAIENLIP